jgi:hypothetical protein
MKKYLAILSALAFTMSLGVAQAANDAKKEDPVAKACKGKKAGDTVKVDGKDVKCPDTKKK